MGNWSIGQDSFEIDPPNAVLIYEDNQTGDLDNIVLELFKPQYDLVTNSLSYTVITENTTSISLPKEFRQGVLVIDEAGRDHIIIRDCPSFFC